MRGVLNTPHFYPLTNVSVPMIIDNNNLYENLMVPWMGSSRSTGFSLFF